MSNFKELAEDYFDRHELGEECHITADGRVFHQKATAESFSSGLEDSKIESFFRDTITAEPTDLEAPMLVSEEAIAEIETIDAQTLISEEKAVATDVKPKKAN